MHNDNRIDELEGLVGELRNELSDQWRRNVNTTRSEDARVKELLDRAESSVSYYKPKRVPRGKTFTCGRCGDRCDTIKDHNGLFGSDGRPICGACEGVL